MNQPPGMGTAASVGLQCFRCYSSCAPGGSGLFLAVYKDKRPTADPAIPYLQHGDAGDCVEIFDPFYNNCVLGGAVGEGEFTWAFYEPYFGGYTFLGSQGLTRKCVLTGSLAPGGSASGSIVGYKPDGSALNPIGPVTVYHWGQGSDETWNGNIVVHYSPSEHKWYAATDQT